MLNKKLKSHSKENIFTTPIKKSQGSNNSSTNQAHIIRIVATSQKIAFCNTHFAQSPPSNNN